MNSLAPFDFEAVYAQVLAIEAVAVRKRWAQNRQKCESGGNVADLACTRCGKRMATNSSMPENAKPVCYTCRKSESYKAEVAAAKAADPVRIANLAAIAERKAIAAENRVRVAARKERAAQERSAKMAMRQKQHDANSARFMAAEAARFAKEVAVLSSRYSAAITTSAIAE